MLAVAAILAVLGLALLVFGVRGRAVDTYAACRACRFDLTGLSPGAAVCPECGAGLGARAVVRIARRRRARPLFAAVGALALLLGGSGTGLLIYARVMRFDLNRIKPDWWLVIEARVAPTPDPGVLDQLVARLGDGSLSGLGAAFLVDRALAEQANPDGAWFERWDDIFATAHSKGRVNADQLKAYAANAVVRRFEHRSAVRRGSAWRLGKLVTAVRMAAAVGLSEELRPERVYVGDALIWTNPFAPGASFAPLTPHASMVWRQLDYAMPGLDLPPGRYPVRVVGSREMVSAVAAAGPSPIVKDTQEFRSTIEVVPTDARTVEFVTDETVRERVKAAIDVVNVRLYIDDRDRHATSAIRVSEPPVDLSFDVYCRAPGREWLIGRFVVARGSDDFPTVDGSGLPADGFEGGNVDLILRPSADAAESVAGPDVRRAWGEEIVFPAIAVQVIDRRKGASPPR